MTPKLSVTTKIGNNYAHAFQYSNLKVAQARFRIQHMIVLVTYNSMDYNPEGILRRNGIATTLFQRHVSTWKPYVIYELLIAN